MELLNYVTENALIIIPALYIIGAMLKGTEKVQDKFIPILLLPVGIAFCISIIGFNVQAIIQGILVTGAAVYTNQFIKQINKKGENKSENSVE